MPVSCKSRGDKWRITDPDGSITTNSSGTAVDGGGHSSKAACNSQARAINARSSSMEAPNLSIMVGPEGKTAKFIAASGKFNVDGQPVQRLIKDLIGLGIYTHPWYGWTWDVTKERMELWVGAFKVMQENGVKVPITLDHSISSEDCLGYVIDMYIEGDKLMGVHEFAGEASIDLATRIEQVSILLEKDFVDGKDRSYGEAIIHSSLTSQPIVPEQDEFVPLAAARGQKAQRAARFVYQSEQAQTTVQHLSKEPKMEMEKLLQQIREALGAGEDLAIEGIPGRISERLEAGKTDKVDLEKKIVELTGKIEALEAKAASLNPSDKGTETPKVDPDLIEDLAESADTRIGGLVEKGKLTPAAAASLRSCLIGEQGKRHEYALSRRVSGTPDALVRQICKALEENDPAKLVTPDGRLMFAVRPVPDETAAEHDPDVTQEMVAMAEHSQGGK